MRACCVVAVCCRFIVRDSSAGLAVSSRSSARVPFFLTAVNIFWRKLSSTPPPVCSSLLKLLGQAGSSYVSLHPAAPTLMGIANKSSVLHVPG